MVLCSPQRAGATGNVGQADYATANAFLDAFAKVRNSLVEIEERRGQTLSINWPLWREGGMGVDGATQNMTKERLGLVAMETTSGIKAFYQALASTASHVMVLEGDLRKHYEFVSQDGLDSGKDREAEVEDASTPEVKIGKEALEEKAVAYFKRQLSKVLKLPIQRIQAEEALEKYGIDSIMVMQLTNQLEKSFGSLSKTLFFEYQTIQAISRYFLEFYRPQLIKLLKIHETTQPAPSPKESTPSAFISRAASRQLGRRRFESLFSQSSRSFEESPLNIAIIGLSGRYPRARDLEEYWANLREGRDCLSEVPKDRWDWREYYTADRSQLGAHYSKWGGFIEDVDKFDPLFFNISPREAVLLDPQERLFLGTVWKALEDAGYCRSDLVGEPGEYLSSQVGVYAGVMYGEYQLFGVEASRGENQIGAGSSYASIANRVSYVLNLHGPSMTLDTMCSSSLTTIHLACQDLKLGRTDLAIAGGVNVSIHPQKYLGLSMGQFISSRGRCESFGEGGDGYIPGEGVGVAVLKRLVDAERDGDHIYGVIRGSAVNHGGKTNGYSVPNPNAQEMVIARALKEARIDPRTISYIEAHGTGTKLGDPIEITGLTKAFKKITKDRPSDESKDRQHCWIGSVKSNIGHCESAAGIAGVTKVLLQMQYGKIVPSLHSQVLNPHIDFTETPFVVNQELQSWERPTIELNGQVREYSRIAGISSFGAGGSNAHVIIEEWPTLAGRREVRDEGRGAKGNDQRPALIVLSAKNEDRLKESAKNLLTYVTVNREPGTLNLHEVAYTLQVGREAMEERLAVMVRSAKEFEEKLKDFLENQENIEDLYRGQVKRNKDTLAIFVADEDMAKTIDAWIRKEKYTKLLDLWVKGLVFDWNKLYGESKPRRISLPTYPFAKERYWISGMGVHGSRFTVHGSADRGLRKNLHPLVHENTSTLGKQRFCSTFTDEEFFFKDHEVNGQKVLPGVAYLEIARAAVKEATSTGSGQAAESLAEEQRGIQLKNVVWARYLAVNSHAQEVHIGLFPEENGQIQYEIYTEVENGEEEPVVHSQGLATFCVYDKLPHLDLPALRTTMNKGHLSSNQCYDAFKRMGIDYGYGYQGLESVYVDKNLVLAKLSLPSSVLETQDHFVLHPTLLDSALQASIGMLLIAKTNSSSAFSLQPTVFLSLPFTLEEVEILRRCASSMWALIRWNKGGHSR